MFWVEDGGVHDWNGLRVSRWKTKVWFGSRNRTRGERRSKSRNVHDIDGVTGLLSRSSSGFVRVICPSGWGLSGEDLHRLSFVSSTH